MKYLIDYLIHFILPSMLLVFAARKYSVTITQEEITLDTVGVAIQRLRSQPILQIFSLYVIIFFGVMFTDQIFFAQFPFYFFLILFLPLIPAYITERAWNSGVIENDFLNFAYTKAKNMRSLFLVFGIVFSVLFFFISKIIILIIGNLSQESFEFQNVYPHWINGIEFYISYRSIFIFLLLIAISSCIAMYKLLLINYTDLSKYETFKRYYNHSGIISLQLSYFFIGSMVVPVLVYPFRYSTTSIQDFGLGSFEFFEFRRFASVIFIENDFYRHNLVVYGLTLPILMMFPLFLLSVFTLYSKFFPYFVKGRSIDLSNRTQLQSFGLWLGGVIILFSYFISSLYPTDPNDLDNLASRTYFILISGIGLTSYLIYNSFQNKEVCHNCGFYGGKECIYCENDDEIGRLNIINTKLNVPNCPNCRKPWDNLSRRCNHCQYTIVLTCENCSQTINPLWRKCNLCGTPRLPVPEVALTQQIDNRFSYIRARYIIIVLMTLPIFVIELLYFNYLSAEYERLSNLGVTINGPLLLHDNLKRILIWVIGTFSILILIYLTLKETQNSKLIIVDEFYRLTFSELFPYMIVVLYLFLFRAFQFFNFALGAIYFVVLTIISIVYSYIRYNNFKNFETFTISMEKNRRGI